MNHAPAAPLRVVEIETFGRGGLLHYAFNLSEALAERGHRVDLLTAVGCELQGRPLPPGMRLTEGVGRQAARHDADRQGTLARLASKAEVLWDARAVARHVRTLAPDVIHLHNTNTSAIAYLMALKRLRIPLVATAHQVTPHERIALQDPIYRRIHALPDLLIAHTAVDRRRLRDEFGVPGEKTVVIPHGDYGFFADVSGMPDRAAARDALGIAAEAPVALFFGYLREYKGVDLLLEAWPRVLDQVPEARLVVAGDPVRLSPDQREGLRRQAEAVGAVHRFEYIPMDEVATHFAAADLLALPYRHISQSGVLYLAFALGVPVVASAVGAWPDMLDDGDNALLVEPGSVDELAAALARALADPALRRRLAEGGRALSEAHAWPKVAERTEEAFRALMAQSRS